MESRYWYKFDLEPDRYTPFGYDYDFVGFKDKLMDFELDWLAHKVEEIYYGPVVDCSCLYDAVTLALEEFFQALGIKGEHGTPFEANVTI